MPSPQPSEAAVEALAERNAIKELWGWWEDTPSREAKEGRQRQRYAQLPHDVKESWRKGAREQLEIVYPHIEADLRAKLSFPTVAEEAECDPHKLAELLYAFANHLATELPEPIGYYPAWAGRVREAALLLTTREKTTENLRAKYEGEIERLEDGALWLKGSLQDWKQLCGERTSEKLDERDRAEKAEAEVKALREKWEPNETGKLPPDHPQIRLEKAEAEVEKLREALREFDAWLSFRGEFREVLTAFRKMVAVFGQDSS